MFAKIFRSSRLGILVLILISACSAPSAVPSTAQPAVTSAPAETAALQAPAAVSASPVEQSADLLGVWTIQVPGGTLTDLYFKEDGGYTLFIHRGEQVNTGSGKYWFENGQIFIKDDFCPTPGKYLVAKDASGDQPSLTFTLVEDSCEARQKIMASWPAAYQGAQP